jgi:UDP-N-acetylmuramoyl-tripeptide--D-alanyl-D-alanine ligase
MSHLLEVPVTMGAFLRACGGEGRGPETYRIRTVITDTRDSPAGAGGVFFALRGRNDDGHRHVAAAAERADYCVVAEAAAVPERWADKRILVGDTLDALNALARLCRDGVPGLRVVAVAGSNGKTTTKELLHALLATSSPTTATEGNRNNRIGVSFTLFSVTPATRCCVVETGISEPGEMEALGRTVSPDIAVLTNIGREHLEYLGDVDGVFREETTLLNHVRPGGWAVLNADDTFLSRVRFPRVRTFGLRTSADVVARDVHFGPDGMSFTLVSPTGVFTGEHRITTMLSGRHQVQNVLAAVAAASLCGVGDLVTMAKTLSSCTPVQHRGRVIRVGQVTIVDECYNANPESMRAALQLMVDTYPDQPRFAVLGDMLELGDASDDEHRRLMDGMPSEAFRWIGTVGSRMRVLELPPGTQRVHADDVASILSPLRTALAREDQPVVLVKGSRGMRLERVVEALLVKNPGGTDR